MEPGGRKATEAKLPSLLPSATALNVPGKAPIVADLEAG